MKRTIYLLVMLMAVLTAQAQMMNPVHFRSELNTGQGAEGEIVFTATIDPGWHVYSTDLGQDGPIAATFNAVKMEGVETVGRLTPRGSVIKKYDAMFGMELKYFEHAATFVQKVRFTKPQYTIDCYLEYGACNDEMCMPPSQVEFKKTGEISGVTAGKQDAKTDKTEATSAEQEPTSSNPQEAAATADAPLRAAAADSSLITLAVDSLWAPVVDELRAASDDTPLADQSLLYILLMGFVGGLLAVCMPCIWPIIPMTVSFFLKRRGGKGARDAITYGLSIIVIYLGLGLLVTALFGSDALNAMSTNAVFNIFLFLLLVAFALSFFGWFEISLPDSWATKVDQKSEELSSIFLMAFTLVLVSFSCTAPIIGLLLVETTTTGNWLAPAVGMLGFAVALALPFTLFALFPSWLKQAPKSGSWMNTIKVVLGFIELAFALKFFSVADLAYGWHLLDREVFLSLWIVIFGLLGAYLCGWLKFQADAVGGELHKPMPVVCI
ncbi:MAG: thiol:disulfide interchange protein, partial [Prevotella sp.]|nr:thiol:disulfide interchange protein [Prevotella sp.]